jgi:hypothetical protein
MELDYYINSKLQAYIDIYSNRYKYSYDTTGCINYITTRSIEIEFKYSLASCDIKIAITKETGSRTSLLTSVKYNDFNWESDQKVKQGNELVLKMEQIYTKTGLLSI